MANYAYALILIGVVNVFFGIYAWGSVKESQSVRLFAYSVLAVGMWGIGLAGFLYTREPSLALFWAKFHYVASIYIAYFVLLFILSISWNKKVSFVQGFLLHLPILLISLVTVFSNELLIRGVSIEASGNTAILYRPGHIIYGSIFVIYFLTALIVNLVFIFKSRGIEKKQLTLIFAGLLLAGILGGVFNLLLPLLGNYKLIWVGPQFTIIFLGVTFIGILRYQLFNMRLLAGKVINVLGSSLFFYFAFVLFLRIHEIFFDSVFSTQAMVFGFFSAVLIVLLYQKYEYLLQKNISSRIVNLGFEASKYIERFNSNLGNMVTEEEILKEVSDIIFETINPLYFSVMLDRGDSIINKQYKGNKVFDLDIVWESVTKAPFKKETNLALGSLVGSFKVATDSYDKKTLDFIHTLEKNDLYLLIPIYYTNQVLGIFVLGKRDLSSTMYIHDEISFLESLSSITGASLARATLYEQVDNLNRNLQKEVDEQTKELQQKVLELEEARRKERDMIDIMGHELRTPITIAKLNIDLMKKYIETNPKEYKKYLDRVKNSIENEIRLINALLTSAKLEGEKVELHRERISLKEIIENVVHTYAYEAENKKLKVMQDIDEDMPDIFADKVRVTEIMDNLLNNAIKYTEEGSVIIQTSHTPDHVQVNVIDSGMGIPDEEIPKLGTKFHRVGNYIKGKDKFDIVRPGGTGLGLYVVFALVEQMGGKIWVKSDLGKGTTFSFTLPVYTNQTEDIVDTKTNDMYKKFGLKKS